jgi:hypothetical protein
MPDEMKPTPDEQRGMDWWSALTVEQRKQWLTLAKSARPVDAWELYKESQGLVPRND